MMEIKDVLDLAPWDWPEDTGRMLQDILDDHSAELSDRLLAAEMAGDTVVINDKLARTLLAVVDNSNEAEELRAKAVIAFGPALEHGDLYEFDDPDDILLSEDFYREVQASLQKIYHDGNIPKEVRRRTLEAAVRAPQDWHPNAVRAAYASDDKTWRLTAVFCMRFIEGFDRQIVEALHSNDRDIRYEALRAAGNWGIAEAWPQVAELLAPDNEDRSLLLAAIETAADIGTPKAIASLEELLDSNDDDIIDAVHEFLAMLKEMAGSDDAFD